MCSNFFTPRSFLFLDKTDCFKKKNDTIFRSYLKSSVLENKQPPLNENIENLCL